MSLQVCTDITDRELTTKEKALGILGPGDALDGPCGDIVVQINGGCNRGAKFDENCNNEQEEQETILTFSTVSSGLIKGLLNPTTDTTILTRRERYEMDVRAQYRVEDPISKKLLFEYNSEPVQVSFQHPFDISLVNKLNKQVTPLCSDTGQIRGQTICSVNQGTGSDSTCNPSPVNGAHINATEPYQVRVELQFKGEALPAGVPINVTLFKHTDDSLLNIKSDRTSIREGVYTTTAIDEPLRDPNGKPTGAVVSKSIVDIDIPAPALPDIVDVYVSIDHLGFFVDAVHTVQFIGSLFIRLNVSEPKTNGIDRAEQFAEIWTLDPDAPNDANKIQPAPDGTLVKWELLPLRFGKNRPFFSEEKINELISGVYSTTLGGRAGNVFFGPISNIENHTVDDGTGTACCLGEEYAIKASVALGDETAIDLHYLAFPCQEDDELVRFNKFLMNAASGQPGQAPNYITWADGESLLRFLIARSPATTTDAEVPGADCFQNCTDILGQLLDFQVGQIIQITAPGEILWNVTFSPTDGSALGSPTIEKTGDNILTFESIAPPTDSTTATAGIPVTGDVTEFFVRLNKFIGEENNPQPEDCGQSTSGGLGGLGEVLLSCEWESRDCNKLELEDNCPASFRTGVKWKGVSPVFGSATLIGDDNASIVVSGGGNYSNGIPPILVGFKEPLDVRVIETRVNGVRVNNQDLIVNGIQQHTFVVEVTFANEAVPDGTEVELLVEGTSVDIIKLSACGPNLPASCQRSDSGTIFTVQRNDPFINPTGDKRSLAYFSIDPLIDIAFNAKINVTCRFDKLGTAIREITRCIELNNTINVDTPEPIIPTPTPIPPTPTSVTTNENIIYDTVADSYSTVVGANINRIGHFASARDLSTNDFIYLFGGFTDHDLDASAKITATAEKYDVGLDAWTFITDMPTPRASGMTVTVGDEIYCIGGLELDPLIQQYVTSSKIESFNTVTETWNPSLKPMEDSDTGDAWPIAFGDAQYDGTGSIYVLCGLKSVINSNQPDEMNNRMLRYTINTDTWTVIRPLDIDLYTRIAPFGFFRSSPQPADTSKEQGYIYGGSIAKSLAAINAEFVETLNKRLNDFRSFILTSPYYLSLSETEQKSFIEDEEQKILETVQMPPFIYPSTGFKYVMGSEHIDSTTDLVISIADKVDNEWTILPTPRDRGQAVYISSQDTVYFMGGTNQNTSTTLNRVESIDLASDANTYLRVTPFSRGRSLFSAIPIQDDIYLSGGLTSGHRDGYVEIDLFQSPLLVEAQGTQSSGVVIILRDDAGELIDEDIR